jgi:hypothetical protein
VQSAERALPVSLSPQARVCIGEEILSRRDGTPQPIVAQAIQQP